MFGEHGRIGLMVPSVNTVVEPEFRAALPSGVAVYSTRMRNSRADVSDSAAMLDHVERAADELASAHVNVIAFACTASSFVHGQDGETELREKISAIAGVPVVTSAGAVADALTSAEVTKVALATPYSSGLNELEETFLAANGFEITTSIGLDIEDAYQIGCQPPGVAAKAAMRAWDGTAEALFISCTNLATQQVIGPLERELGVPVVSSNSATFRACMQALERPANEWSFTPKPAPS